MVVAGHSGRRGKTTLCEAMLYHAGATDRLGRVSDGTAVTDSDPEEKAKLGGVCSVAPLEYHDVKINLLDTRDFFDFAAGMYEGIRAAGSAPIRRCGKSKIRRRCRKSIQSCKSQRLVGVFCYNQDRCRKTQLRKSFRTTQRSARNKAVPGSCSVHRRYSKIKYFVNLAQNKAYEQGREAF